jgi:ketosteroid isomerase-like protein
LNFPAFERPGKANANVEIVRRTWELIERGEFDALGQTLAPDIVWKIPAMSGVPFAGAWRGLEQVRDFFRIVDAAQDPLEFSPSEVIAEADTIIVLGEFANRVRASGEIARSAWAQVWKVREGLVASMVEFVDTHAVWRAYATSPQCPEGDAI